MTSVAGAKGWLAFNSNLRFLGRSELKKKLKIFYLVVLQIKRGKIVAESFTENIGFDERIAISGKFYKSFILFWDFEDLHLIEPILILSSPLEIICFEFHPKDPNIVVGNTKICFYSLITNFIQNNQNSYTFIMNINIIIFNSNAFLFSWSY